MERPEGDAEPLSDSLLAKLEELAASENVLAGFELEKHARTLLAEVLRTRS